MELKLFATQTIFNNEENRHNPFTKYASDIDNKVFLFLNKNNSILYYNSQNSILKTIDEYKNLSLLHFIIFTDKHFICILYNNGDILIDYKGSETRSYVGKVCVKDGLYVSTAWQPNKAYVVGDIFYNDDKVYKVLNAHTSSGSFVENCNITCISTLPVFKNYGTIAQ